MSDLHLEFAHLNLNLQSWPDLVILAGDIGYGTAGIEFAQQQLPTSVPVVVLAGNHEFYESSIETVTHDLRLASDKLSNIHFLDCDDQAPSWRPPGADPWSDALDRFWSARASDAGLGHGLRQSADE